MTYSVEKVYKNIPAMNPASREYYHTLEMLMEELRSFKSQQGELKFQISKLFDENKKLTNELKENIILREQQLTESGYIEIEQKFQDALAQKNAAVELWQEALRRLEVQEEQLIGRKNVVECERNESEKLLEQMKEEYVKGLNILSTEVTNYRSELLNATKDVEQKTNELEQCKNDLERLGKEVSVYKKTVADLTSQKAEAEDKVASLQSLLSETEKFLTATKEEMALAKSENFDLATAVMDLKEQNKKLKSEIEVYGKDTKESLLAAQEAILQKKEIAYREEQYLKEIEHLKQSIEAEAEKVTYRCKAEMKDIQKESSQKVQKLMEEIQSLHQEISDKQSLFEKAVREKQALESKLELLYSECSNGVPSSNGTFDDLCKRLTMSEKARDELEFRAKGFETELREVKYAREQEVQGLLDEQNRLKERLHKLSEDFNQSSSDRLKLSDESTKLKKRCSELEKELRLARTRQASELSDLRDESRQKLQSVNDQLLSNEEHFKRVCSELQGQLEAESKISNMWKEEIENLVTKSESKISELHQVVSPLRNQNRELVNILKQTNPYVSNLELQDTNRFSSRAYAVHNPSD